MSSCVKLSFYCTINYFSLYKSDMRHPFGVFLKKKDGPYFRHVAMKQTRRYHSLIGYARVSSTYNDVLQLNTPVLNGCNLRDKLIYKQGKGRVRLHNQSPLNRQLPVEKAGNLIAHSPIWYIISAIFLWEDNDIHGIEIFQMTSYKLIWCFLGRHQKISHIRFI